ncbi:long-chain fatty acid--CoA ligase [Chloroflexus aggregans]|uniref:Acyl-CoA synthetase n=1 Tax=Chloroflexus aggregans (strain MD-66 / DSM 9485) TaxID=326427 RepID=B8G3C4_CHLAD|nr:long-chain fatty acid--CoA ligase [Chloroflexus aggregans]ACL25297.1 AMP-dependent synthetase and ligase [Chloroflexus aggregans DSM 9485]
MIQIPETTIPRLLFQNAERFGDKVALREKDFGIWQTVTWRQFAEHVRAFAMGLHALGVRRGDVVAIIGDNRPEWLYAEFAAQAIGAMSIGVYQDSVAEEVYYVVSAAEARVIVVEDQEQVDKVIEIWPRLSGVLKVIYYESKGMRNYRQPYLAHFPDIEELGRAYDREHPGLFDAELAAGKPDDVAILSTTSGTTGKPKLAMLTHRNLISQGAGLLSVDPLGPDDEFVSFLPLAWVGEQMVTVAAGMQCGFTINFPESASTVQENIREIGPRVMFSPPRIWENMLSQVQVKIQDSTPLKRAIFEWAMKQGYAMADARFSGQRPSLGLRLRYGLARLLVFEMLKDHLGLRFLKRAYTGGAALGPDVFRFYHAIGVNLKQVYGQTESAGLSVIHRDGQIKFQTVGTPLPNTEIRIAENGEILVKSPSVFVGYYKNPEATAEALEDGWLHSGDAGYFDEDGHLIVIDRAKDVMTLHDGTKFSPQFIENKLKFSPYIKEAVVFGGDWPFVTAMINIDFANVGKWAENAQISYTTYTDLAQKPQVYALIRKDVERANADLPPAARIRRFLLLHKELDADDGELTRTRKVRRRLIAQRYQEIVDALYGDQSEFEIETTITYQDGRTALIKTRLRIEELADPSAPAPAPAARAVAR